jgi:hypothetical protein
MSNYRRQTPKLLCLKQWMMFDIITLQTFGESENMLAIINGMGFCIAPLKCVRQSNGWLGCLFVKRLLRCLFKVRSVELQTSKVVLLCISCSLTYSSRWGTGAKQKSKSHPGKWFPVDMCVMNVIRIWDCRRRKTKKVCHDGVMVVLLSVQF